MKNMILCKCLIVFFSVYFEFRIEKNYNNINSYVLVDILDEMLCAKEISTNTLKWLIIDQIKIGPYKKMEEYYEQILDVFK